MNDEMFFYPPYPFDSLESGYDSDKQRGMNNELATPEKTLELGNAFLNEYSGYKNYQPYSINITNQDSVLYLVALKNYCHDLKLHLDIYPNDQKIKAIYEDTHRKVEELKKRIDMSKIKCPMEDVSLRMEQDYLW